MKLTHKQKILNLLKDGQWHHFRELNDICFRYGARLYDLKKQDGITHEIKKVNGVEYYRLKSEWQNFSSNEPLDLDPEQIKKQCEEDNKRIFTGLNSVVTANDR